MSWHRHRWTKWSKPFQFPESRYIAWFQDRTCDRCDRVQRRQV